VIAHPETRIALVTGYSRELYGNTHAEENALTKLLSSEKSYSGLDMYTTMEPCSTRLSGNKACTERIIDSGGVIRRVILGVREPDDFVLGVGMEKLRERGFIVVRNEDVELERECLEVAKRGHSK
jgi:pyrimidine deaminase RibD-like protein